MLKRLLFLFLASLPICIQAQTPTIARDYHHAIKNQTIKPIAAYLLNTEQTIKILSWSKNLHTTSYVDSMNRSYHDSLLQHFHKLYINLKEKGFNLKNSKLIKAERSLGVFGQLTLYLSHKNKITPISEYRTKNE